MAYGLRPTDYGLHEWRVLIDEGRSAAEHMALDERLARDARPLVRFFTWNPAALSLGWKQPPPEWFDVDHWRAAGLKLVERPTGGGIAFHGSDVSVTVVVPRAPGWPLDQAMEVVCNSAQALCRSFGSEPSIGWESASERITYCLTERSPYAVFIGERKVAGFALRRYPTSWLIQGSLLVKPLPPALAQAIPGDVAERVRMRAVPLAEVAERPVDESAVIERWAKRWSSLWSMLQAASPRLQATSFNILQPEACGL